MLAANPVAPGDGALLPDVVGGRRRGLCQRGAMAIRTPHPRRDALGIASDAIALEIAAYVGEVAPEQFARIGVEARIDRLRKIDRDDRAVPIQDVVGREIAVDTIEVEPQTYVAQDALE